MLRALLMASLHCPNPECPFLKKFKAPAEFREGFSTCSDCGSALVAGSAPTPAPVVAVAEQAPELAASLPRAQGASSDFTRRGVVSLAALIAAALSNQVLLPGIDPFVLETIEMAGMPSDSVMSLGVFSLALNPLLPAFIIVELAALLIPPWRRLRVGGPRERARLRTAALVLGLAFALVQAFGMVQFYSNFDYEGRTLFSGPSALPMPVTALVLVGAVVALHLLTMLVDRAGLGSGYGVVLVGLSLPAGASAVSRLWMSAQQGRLGTGELVLVALGFAGIVWGTVLLLRGRVQGHGGGTERPRWLPLPASGIAPLSFAGVVLAVPGGVGMLLDEPGLLEVRQALEGNLLVYSFLFFVLMSLLTAGFSVLFHQPRHVGAVWAGLTAKEPAERSVVQGRAALRARELLPTAAAWSLAFMTLAWLPPLLASGMLNVPLPSALALLLAVAVALDLFDEARMRRAGTWTRAWPVHRPYEVEPALAALTAAGIAAWAQGVHARTLLQFFGPYLSIELMVPPDRAQEAQALLEKSRQP